MLIPNHPHDERLSAMASGDPEALADSVLSEHVASCQRCTDTVAELGALRTSLGELPDLPPHRPLRLLPPVTDVPPSRVDGVGTWARRFFAPVLTAGAALAMVGLVGTTAPLFGGLAGQADSAQLEGGAEMAAPQASSDEDAANDVGTYGGQGFTGGSDSGTVLGPGAEAQSDEESERSTLETQDATVSAERSIWPMVLFAGVAVMIAAALLRWILAPRAG
jgi:anti-sigma factor RsiW